MRLVTAALALLATGCASRELPRVPESVMIEVPVACIRELPVRPNVRTTAQLLAMDRFSRTIATWADRLALDAYARELEAVADGCSRLPNR